MASLIETLIDVLDKENTEYEKLLELSKEKTSYIVKNDTVRLQEIVVREQEVIDVLNGLEEFRMENVKDICNVLNLRGKDTKLDDIVEVLRSQPQEHDALDAVNKKLRQTISQLSQINDNNKMLIQESLDMIEFELNLAKNAVLAPQTANYNGTSYDQNNIAAVNSFDAKQ